jgi:hypothetical protein
MKPPARLWAPGVVTLLVLGLAATGLRGAPEAESSLGFAFTNVAREAGLTAVTVFGGKETNKYLLETTGCGAAFLDYDNDGWLDAFLVNGTALEGFPKGQEPTNHLYRNRGDGTFEDVTARSGLGAGSLRGRLRQRRLHRPRRDLLGAEPALPQPG